jgi:sensor c-di-GMP phosphodiesterase-like protein
MHNKRIAVVVFIAVAVLAIAAPIAISLYLAREQSLDEQTVHATQLARDVLRRGDEAAAQMTDAIVQLERAGAADPCSSDMIALMAQISVVSEQVQGLGYVADGRLLCSSFGRYPQGIPVGPADYVSANGVSVRSAVSLPSIAGVKFILTTRESGYTSIIHPKLPLDVFTDDPSLSVGIIGYSVPKPIDVRGYYDPRWLDALGNTYETSFVDRDHIVAVLRSHHADIVAFAAIAASNVTTGLRRLALILVPIGTLAGVVLALAVLYVARLQLAMPAVLRIALRRNEFYVEYQPVVDLRTGAWVGAEALLRWRRGNGELVRPDLFIPVAEEAGLISRITAQVLRIVARDAVGLFARHPDFHIAVNLAPADLANPRILEQLKELAERTGGRGENFIAEATERGVIKGSTALTVIKDIRAAGIRVAIDDFGTGYSSLSYLQTLDVDFLKIDKSFIDTIGADAATSQVVAHIVEMAKSLNLGMIAEGVETEAQRDFLRDRGVDYAQGWLFARPMAMDALKARLRTALAA